MLGLLIFSLFAFSAGSFALRFAEEAIERMLLVFLAFTLEVYGTALLLSLAENLSHPLWWLMASATFSFLAEPWKIRLQADAGALSWKSNSLLWAIPILFLAALNFFSAMLNVPGNWDVLSYHLPRALYFLQFDSFASYPTPYWPQITHPTLGPAWLIFSILVGANEHFLFLPQFLAWMITALAIYGIAKALFPRTGHAEASTPLRAFLVASLSLFPLIQMLGATAERNDVLVTAYGAISFYFLFSQHRQANAISLISLALATAAKGTALPLIPVWAVAAYVMRDKNKKIKLTPGTCVGALLAAVLFFSCGYGKNIFRYGSLIGPADVIAQHKLTSGDMLEEGTKNVFRFGIDALTPDGWPGIKAADWLVQAWRSAGLNLGNKILGQDLRAGKLSGEFTIERPSLAHEDPVYSGFVYVLLALYAVAIFLRKEEQKATLLAWSMPALGLFLFHSFTVWYDPWHGRHFSAALIFLVPLLARGLELAWRSKSLRTISVVLLAFLYAQNVYSIAHRNNQSFFPQGSRLEQMMRNRGNFLSVYQKLEQNLPERGQLATRIPGDQPEYILFGPKLSRVVLPTNDFDRGLLNIPPSADWFFFHSSLEKPRAGDIDLGQDFYLRKLKP
ncbi:MAG: hypothetical protein AB7K68_14885 [Bacteriovoracia bacterium]